MRQSIINFEISYVALLLLQVTLIYKSLFCGEVFD